MSACAGVGDDLLADYVDGLLPLDQERRIERHLIACQGCLAVVREERELMSALRNVQVDSGRHQQLVAGLLSLAGEQQPAQPRMRPAPATLASHAPAQYCSARRSVAFTLAAVAGCLGAALTVSQVPAASAPAGPADGHVPSQSSLSRTVPAAWSDTTWTLTRTEPATGVTIQQPGSAIGQVPVIDAMMTSR